MKAIQALITGGTGALGRVVTEEFVRQGMRVSVSVRPGSGTVSLSRDIRGSVNVIEADLSSEEDVSALFSRAREGDGEVSVLLNLAGGYVPGRPVAETEMQDWEQMLTVNLRTMFLSSREYLRQKDTSRYGRIISIASKQAVVPAGKSGAYAVSKGGVVVLTRVLAEELKGTEVTANAIAPGIIDTAPNRASMPDADYTAWVRPESIARTILYLCSEDARAMNGNCIRMFGGL